MSKFVLTAQLQLQAPTNTRSVVNQLRSQLQGQLNIPVSVTGSVQATKQLSKVKQQTQQATTAAHNMGKAFGASIKRFAAFNIATRAVGLLASKLSQAVDDAIQFERQLIKISQVTGKTTQELSGLVQEVTSLSTALGVSSSSLLETTRILAQAGIQAGDLKVALAALAKTTLAPTFDNITQTAEGAVAILAQFEQGVGSLEAQLGAINAVAGQFAVESGDLISVIRRAGGVFKQAGGSLNELLGLFTSVRATTRENAESIATGLRTIFTRIQRPQTIQYLKQFGVELLDLEGKFVGPFEAVRQLNIALSGLEEGDIRFVEIAEQLGGFRQIGKVIPLIQQFDLAERSRQAAVAGGNSLNEDAVIAQQALAVQIEKTKEKFLALIRSISETSTFRIMIKSLLGIAEAFIKVAEAIKPIIPLIATFAAFKFARGIGGFASGLGAGLKGKNRGGKIHAFARGGTVPGAGNRDTVPAMLTPGEFVIRKSSVNKIGAGTLAAMNENKYAEGGPVSKNIEKVGKNSVAIQKLIYRDKKRVKKKRGANFKSDGDKQNQFTVNDTVNSNITKRKIGINQGVLHRMPFTKQKQLLNSKSPSVQGIAFEDYLRESKRITSPAPRFSGNEALDGKKGKELIEVKRTGVADVKLLDKLLRDQLAHGNKLKNQTLSGGPEGDIINLPPLTELSLNTASLSGLKAKDPIKKGKNKFFGGPIRHYANAGRVLPLSPTELSRYKSLNAKGKKATPEEKKDRKTLETRFKQGGTKGPKTFNSGRSYGAVYLERATSPKGGKSSITFPKSKGKEEVKVGFNLDHAFLDPADGKKIKKDIVTPRAEKAVNETASYLARLIGEKVSPTKNIPNFQAIVGSVFEKGVELNSKQNSSLDIDDGRTFDFAGGLGNASKAFGADGAKLRSVKTDAKVASTSSAVESVRKKVKTDLTQSRSTLGFAKGGGVPSSSDTVPAMLTPGEFVINKKASQSIGYGNLNKMNKQGVVGFASGGAVSEVQKFTSGGTPSPFITSADRGSAKGMNIPGAKALSTEYNKRVTQLQKAGASEKNLALLKKKFLEGLKKAEQQQMKSLSLSKSMETVNKSYKKILQDRTNSIAAQIRADRTGGGGKTRAPGGTGGGMDSFTTIFALQAALALVGPALTDLAKEVGEDGELIATGTSEVIDNLLGFTTALIAAGFVISQFTGVQAFFTGSMAFAGTATTGYAVQAQAAGNALGPFALMVGGAYLAVNLLVSSIEKYRQLQKKLNDEIEKGNVDKAGEAGEALSVSNTGSQLAQFGGAVAAVVASLAVLAWQGFKAAAAMGTTTTVLGSVSLGLKAFAAQTVLAKIGLVGLAGGAAAAVAGLLYLAYVSYGTDEAARQKAQADALAIRNTNLAAQASENAAKELEKIEAFEKTAQSALLGNEGQGSPTVQQALLSSGLESAQKRVQAAETKAKQVQEATSTKFVNDSAYQAGPIAMPVVNFAQQMTAMLVVLPAFKDALKESEEAVLARTTAEVKFMKNVQDKGLLRKGFDEEIKMGGDFETWLAKQEQLGTRQGGTGADDLGSYDPNATTETIAMWNAMMNQGTNELRKQFEGQKVEYDALLKRLGALNLGLGGVIGSIKGISLSMNNSLKSLDKDFSGFAAAASTFAASMTDAAMGLDPAEVDAARETFLQQLSGAGANKKQINEVRQKSQGVEFLQRNQEGLLTDFKEAKKTDPNKTDKEVLKDQLKSKLTTAKAAGGAGIDAENADKLIANISGKALNEAAGKMAEGDFAGALALILKESTDRLNKDTKAAADALISINKDLVDSTRKRVAAEDEYIAARKRTIAAELEAAKIREEFGGREVTYNDKLKNLNKSLDAQLTRGGRVGGNAASPGGVSAGELLNISRKRNREQQNINQNRLNNARNTGQARTGSFRESQGDEVLQRSQQDQQALIDYSRERIDLIREEIQIQKEKNKLEKSSLDALLSGDIEGFFKQQAAVGAQAALKSGNQGLVSNFGATAVGAGFQDLAGQKGVDAATKRRAAGMALNQFGITDQGAADVLAEQTPEIRGLEAEARQFADVIQMASKALEGFAKSDLDITTEIVNIVQKRAPEGVKNATPTGTNSVDPNTGQRFRKRNTQRNDAARRRKAELDNRRNQSGNSMGFTINPLSKGGPVYANRGIFVPRGTDTVPAMLTPGEFVVNRASVQRGNNLAVLKAMNSNQQASGPAMAQGGQVQYRQFGGIIDAIGKTFESALPNLQNVFSGFTSAVEKLTGMQIGVKLDASTVTVNIASNVLQQLPELIQGHVYKEIVRQLPKIQHSPNGGHKLDDVG